jgi:3'-phosphoadenosine 5'-phosphosulfate sulfotransferase (PAPS reductase)/FAD synthetase
MENKKIIGWWSGGITSAVACKIALDLFGDKNQVRIIMIDTKNEDNDTYRFKRDCERWYGKPIEAITGVKNPDNPLSGTRYEPNRATFIDIGNEYENIQDVWTKHKSLNVATGAICSTQLKRRVREKWQELNDFDYQVFGFEFDKKECNRALGLHKNHPKAKGIYPLLMMAYDKDDCLKIVQEAGIEIPRMYQLGFRNNNCFKTGCVQGGIGYWQKMQREFPEKFNAMAEIEHQLTSLRGEPVTMLKDQGKEAKNVVDKTGVKWKQFLFLKKHPDYPELKTIGDMKQQEVKPLFECNGFCGTNDLNERISTEQEINFNPEH